MSPPPANCPSCGARVDAIQGDEASVYTCHFCGARISVDPLRSASAGIPEVVIAAAAAPVGAISKGSKIS